MRGVNQFSYEDTRAHADSLLQTSTLISPQNKSPLSTTSRKHNYIHPDSLSTFSPFNPVDTKILNHKHFCSKFHGIELLLWVISLTLQGQVEKCSPSALESICIKHPSFISRRHMHTQTNSFLSCKYALPFCSLV